SSSFVCCRDARSCSARRRAAAAGCRGHARPRRAEASVLLSYFVMDVFLVPVGHGRHELYCEIADDADSLNGDDRPDESTFFGRLKKRAQDAIADAEREWRDRQAGRIKMPTGRWGRMK